jgi:hypothetical protein
MTDIILIGSSMAKNNIVYKTEVKSRIRSKVERELESLYDTEDYLFDAEDNEKYSFLTHLCL